MSREGSGDPPFGDVRKGRFRAPAPHSRACGWGDDYTPLSCVLKQESLRTKDPGEADRLLHARNEAHRQPVINLQTARAYLLVGAP